MKFWSIFKTNKTKLPISSITCGETDEHGFCDTYIDGVKSNVKLLVFSPDEIETLREIQDKIYKKLENE